uniref:Uncharacterized protein n=1 Tax=Myoviridae sp. ctByu2 TaxID=2827668 RepID=A0A8S5S9I1_9CAUD|nr:MAG TPA: hypothetical protein [Myoviridae sp. ctByu2]
MVTYFFSCFSCLEPCFYPSNLRKVREVYKNSLFSNLCHH